MSPRTWGIFLLAAAFAILGFIAYKNSTERQVPIVFSPRNELQALWDQYKKDYFEAGTYRTLDPQKSNITTSEGESYAMLRSVWLDDKDAFDKSWTWTKNNLQRQDHLFSWLFGRRADGTYGVVTQSQGQNTATDADTDIALALVFASGRWNQAQYLTDAKTIIGAIWDNEVVMVKGRPYIAADNVEKSAPQAMLVNPSYLAPYAYRIFAVLDPQHPWLQVVDTSYEVLSQSITLKLDKGSSANIPPDWVMIDKQTGALLPPTISGLTTNTSFDALRVPWRLYLDWLWYNEPRASSTLQSMDFFSSEWREKGRLYTSYEHDGSPVVKNQTAAFYGGTLGYFLVTDPGYARSIYNNKLQVLFSPDSNTWKVKLGYYDDNWAWFGVALYNNMLPNLAVTH